MPFALDSFVDNKFKWYNHFRCESMSTPKYFTNFEGINLFPSTKVMEANVASRSCKQQHLEAQKWGEWEKMNGMAIVFLYMQEMLDSIHRKDQVAI